jgi:CRP-like cAMP-binding protein
VPSLLEKSFILRRLPVLTDVSAEEALHFAAIARDFVAEPGYVVSSQADPPAIFILLSGEMTLAVPDTAGIAPITVRAGDVVGLYETLVGVPVGRSQRIVHRTRALRIERADFFDVMSQHPALPEHVLAALFKDSSLRSPTRVAGVFDASSGVA